MIIKDLHQQQNMQGPKQMSAAFSFQNGQLSKTADEREVVTEHSIAVFVNEQLTANLVCTPTELPELVIGRLITEGILKGTEEVRELYICERASRARVFLHDADRRLQPFVEQSPTCCSDNHVYLCGEGLDRPKPFEAVHWNAEEILASAEEIRNGAQIYRSTHGTHGGFLIHNGKVVFQCEDIGRHNAIDKAIGYLAIQHINPEECMIYSTGRASADMVRKAVRAGIPVFLSKAAPTKAAIEMAHSFNAVLICNIKNKCFDVFSPEHPLNN